jgi:hypothetical protein
MVPPALPSRQQLNNAPADNAPRNFSDIDDDDALFDTAPNYDSGDDSSVTNLTEAWQHMWTAVMTTV